MRFRSPGIPVRPPVEPLERRRLLSTTYYVSPAGKDTNPGTPAKPLATLAAVDKLTLHAGDQVLLAAGRSFAGPLVLTAADGGTDADPIVVGSYGTGRATITAGLGDGIEVLDTAGVDISDLTIIGGGADTNGGAGIQLTNDQAGDTKLDHVHITQIDASGFGLAGVAVGGTTDGAGGGSGFRDVSITDSLVHGNDDAGIFTYAGAFRDNPAPYGLAHEDVYVADVYAYDNAGHAGHGDSGSGIVLGNVAGGTVEHCVAHDNGADNTSTGGGPVGIWTYNSDSVVLQSDESYDNTAADKDGGGFDLDGGSTNCTVQDCYSHGNAGAGILLCQFADATAWTGNVVRYNVSQDDGRRNDYGGIVLWTPDDTVPLQDSLVYGNTVWVSDVDGSSPTALHVNAATDDVRIFNNVLDAAADLSPVEVDQTGPGLTLAGNDYWTGSATALNLIWLGTTVETLPGWRMTAGQEQLGGTDTGLAVDPGLADAGGGGTLANADDLAADLPAYQLTAGSPLVDAGVDLTGLDIDPGPADFYGVALPQGAGFDVGAAEYAAPVATATSGTATSGTTTTGTTNSGTAPVATPTPTATTVALAASVTAPVAVGSAVTFTAAVSPATATGTFTFTTADGTSLGTAAVAAGGTATLTTAALSTGVSAVTAAYAGDADDAASASAAVTVTVNPLALTPALTATTLPATTVAGARLRGHLSVAVTNAAATTETGRTTVELFAAPDGVLDAAAVPVAATSRRLAVRPGRSVAVAVPVTALPAGMAAGTYTWLARVIDAAGHAAISPAGPSLTVSPAAVALTAAVRADRLPGTIAAGRRGGSVTVAVTNTGNTATAVPLSATLYLSTDGTLAGGVTAGTATRRAAVRPGSTATLSVPLGPAPAAGSYTVLVAITDAAGDTAVTVLPTELTVTG